MAISANQQPLWFKSCWVLLWLSHIIALRIGFSLPPPTPLLAAVIHEDVDEGDEEGEESEHGEGVAASRVTRVAR